jgi:hypothetical protein
MTMPLRQKANRHRNDLSEAIDCEWITSLSCCDCVPSFPSLIRTFEPKIRSNATVELFASALVVVSIIRCVGMDQ